MMKKVSIIYPTPIGASASLIAAAAALTEAYRSPGSHRCAYHQAHPGTGAGVCLYG